MQPEGVSMALFKTADPEKALQRDLDTARAAKIKLAERLAAAKLVAAEKAEIVKQLARDNADDKALDIAEAALLAAEKRVSTFTTAHHEAELIFASLEADQNKRTDLKQRAATVAELENISRDLGKAGDDFVSSAGRLGKMAKRIGEIVPDAAGLEQFCSVAANDLPATIEMLKGVIQYHADKVIGGQSPATLPQPAPVAAPLQIVPPTTRLFATRDICWTADGVVHTQHRWTDVELPPTISARALKLGAAVPMDNSVRKQRLGYAKTSAKPKPLDCVNLDADAPLVSDPRATAPVLSHHKATAQPMFAPVDRGKPFVVRTARNGE
jgi:hypothetical protein